VTTEERFQRIENILDALASSIVAHDNQIESLIKVAEQQKESIAKLAESVANTERQWQAYINRLPKQ
jgi:hypothetical protein